MVKSSKEIKFWDESHNVSVYQITSVIMYQTHDDLSAASGYTPGTWLIPMKWNQACFDLIQIATQDEIVVIQVTNGMRHDYKLQHLIPIVNALKVSKVKFITLCRRSNFSEFQSGNLTGQGQLEQALTKFHNSGIQCGHFEHVVYCYEHPTDNPPIGKLLLS